MIVKFYNLKFLSKYPIKFLSMVSTVTTAVTCYPLSETVLRRTFHNPEEFKRGLSKNYYQQDHEQKRYNQTKIDIM